MRYLYAVLLVLLSGCSGGYYHYAPAPYPGVVGEWQAQQRYQEQQWFQYNALNEARRQAILNGEIGTIGVYRGFGP